MLFLITNLEIMKLFKCTSAIEQSHCKMTIIDVVPAKPAVLPSI